MQKVFVQVISPHLLIEVFYCSRTQDVIQILLFSFFFLFKVWINSYKKSKKTKQARPNASTTEFNQPQTKQERVDHWKI